MYGPVRGEHIARSGMLRLHVRDGEGARTLEGLLYPAIVHLYGRRKRPSEGRSILWGTGGSVKLLSGLQSAREETGRNPGQDLCRSTLEGRTPWEAPVAGGLNTRPPTRHSREDQSPGTAVYRAGPALRRRESPLG